MPNFSFVHIIYDKSYYIHYLYNSLALYMLLLHQKHNHHVPSKPAFQEQLFYREYCLRLIRTVAINAQRLIHYSFCPRLYMQGLKEYMHL